MNQTTSKKVKSDKRFIHNISRIFLSCLLIVVMAFPVSAEGITRSTDSSFKDIGVAVVSGGHLNIRSKASTSGDIVGYLENHSAAVIKKTVSGDDGDWYYITSGSVTGYAKASYFKTGDDAKALAKKYGTKSYAVDTAALRVRKEASTSADVVVKLASGTTVKIEKSGISGDGYEWYQITATKNGKSYSGYVVSDYIAASYTLPTAVAKTTSSSSSSSKSSSSSSSSGSSSSKGSKIVSLAKSYVGLKYVYGGTSLKSGADCSGFTKAIYKKVGITLARTARAQAKGGTSIKKSELQPGDLVFYKNGHSYISHVAIYIGGGKIVHEANRRKGCIISSMTCMTPCKYVSYTHK